MTTKVKKAKLEDTKIVTFQNISDNDAGPEFVTFFFPYFNAIYFQGSTREESEKKAATWLQEARTASDLACKEAQAGAARLRRYRETKMAKISKVNRT